MTRQDPSDIRLSVTSYAVLGLVRYFGRTTPYDLKRLIAETLDNFWPVPHTTFYAEPARLAAAGYLSEEREPAGRRRKFYELTHRGREALEAWVADPTTSPPQLYDEAVLKVFLGGDSAAIMRPRVDWHRAKLSELESYLAEVERALAAGEGDPVVLRGMQASLHVGLRRHRMNLQLIDEHLANPDGGA
jgi:DNA-binding PadR family transcriptional regulator